MGLVRIAVTVLTIGLGITLAGAWYVAGELTKPANRVISPPPTDMKVESVTLNGVSGWFIQGPEKESCILLMHGIRSNKAAMLGRAKFLAEAGYSTLLIDLQAHGETPGDRITFGFRESASARQAVNYLRSEGGCDFIAAIGASLGGAASLLGETPLKVDAFILEAVYPTIEKAVYNRIQARLGPLAEILAPLLYLQIPWRLDIPLQALQPEIAIRNIQAPVLILTGTQDRHTTLEDSRNLYNNAPQPKRLLEIEGAKHVDLHSYATGQYESEVLAFLANYQVREVLP